MYQHPVRPPSVHSPSRVLSSHAATTTTALGLCESTNNEFPGIDVLQNCSVDTALLRAGEGSGRLMDALGEGEVGQSGCYSLEGCHLLLGFYCCLVED